MIREKKISGPIKRGILGASVAIAPAGLQSTSLQDALHRSDNLLLSMVRTAISAVRS